MNIEEMMENVSGKYMVVPENIRSGLDFLERRGMIEKSFDRKSKVYTFNVKHKMDANQLIMEHPEVFEGSLLE